MRYEGHRAEGIMRQCLRHCTAVLYRTESKSEVCRRQSTSGPKTCKCRPFHVQLSQNGKRTKETLSVPSQLVSYLVGVGQPSAGAGLPKIHLPLAASGQDPPVPLFPHDRPVVAVSIRNYGVPNRQGMMKSGGADAVLVQCAQAPPSGLSWRSKC